MLQMHLPSSEDQCQPQTLSLVASFYTMCGTIVVYHIGFCPRCRLPDQQQTVEREKRCWTKQGLEAGGQVHGLAELRRLTRRRSERASCALGNDDDDDFDNFIEDEVLDVDGLGGPCTKCLEREGHRADFMARIDSRDPDPYVQDFVREVQGDESRELQQERSYLATANFATHPERDYPKSRTDMTETYLQPSAANNIPQIQRWTEKGNIPFRLSDKSHASSPTTSGRRPSPIFEDPRDAEDYEKWKRAKKADNSFADEHKAKWFEQIAGKLEDDFEDPSTNSEGFSYPQVNAGFAQQGELSSPLEYTRSNWHLPVYAQQAEQQSEGDEHEGEGDESDSEDDELSPLQRRTRRVVEPDDMYGQDTNAHDQGQPEASGEPLDDESEQGSEDGLEHGNEPEPEPEVENVELSDDSSQHWNEGGLDAESEEDSEE